MMLAVRAFLARQRVCGWLGHVWGPHEPLVLSRYLLSEQRRCRLCRRVEVRTTTTGSWA